VPDKKDTRSRENFLTRFGQTIARLFRETIGELRKVSWPTWNEARNLTIVVLVVIFTMAFSLGLLDFVYSRFFLLILKK